MERLSRSPLLVVALTLLLAVPQIAGFATQLARGFRPFGSAPGRIAFSWDMFAPRIERCGINWSPPLPGPIFSLNDLSRKIEWQTVMDTRAGYDRIAAWACSKYRVRNRALLTCFLPQGKEESHVVECR